MLLLTVLLATTISTSVSAESKGFTDVGGLTEKEREQIKVLVDKGIINGYPDGTFRPYDKINRGQLATYLARALDLQMPKTPPRFKDVTVKASTYDGVVKAYGAGLMGEHKEGKFLPGATVSRRSLAVVLEDSLQMKERYPQGANVTYKDIGTLSKREKAAVQRLSHYEIIKPAADGFFRPNQDADRLTMVVALYGLMETRGMLKDFNDYTFDDYFSKVEWIDRKGIKSVSIYPKETLTEWSSQEVREKHSKRSFELLAADFGKDTRWMNTESLYVQYKCHEVFAGSRKVPWNLEPHRTETDYRATVRKSCNP
ncbi:DUF2599 domain-containing protein [Sporosarcina sp. ACRSL]|uniref:DUF2599 domain-containing protein n=1 Tax=Sporosarcina sp. ACRSL TaxID=2918215 RepID=UPI001EF483C9|nr:DUF2599 domain-containing protein [Sporosarcina sp. ACRSL]